MKKAWLTLLLSLAAMPVGADSEPTFNARVYWASSGFAVGVDDCTGADRFIIAAGTKGTTLGDMSALTNISCSAARVTRNSPDTDDWYGGVLFGFLDDECADFIVIGSRRHGHTHSRRSVGNSDDTNKLVGVRRGSCAEDDEDDGGGPDENLGGGGSDGGTGGGTGGGGSGSDEPERVTCGARVTPYWQGPGGFVARPSNGLSADVTISCGTSRWTDTLYARDDGLIVQLLTDKRCEDTQGRVAFDGIEEGAWYWITDSRNAAASPLVCENQLGGSVDAAVPEGVEPMSTDGGTFLRHVSGLIGIVPHIAGGDGFHTGYWRGKGGIVGRPLNGQSARVKVTCGRTYQTLTYGAGDDGLIVELIDRSYCTDPAGNPVSGSLEVSGLADGGWYWVNGDHSVAVAPLLPPSILVGSKPLNPGGLTADDGELGTLFDQTSVQLIAIVPRIGHDE